MIRLKENIQIAVPVEKVFYYASDFSHIAEWDPGVVSSKKRTDGKVGLDTEYDLVLRYGISTARMTYRIIDYDPGRKVVLEGRGASFQARDTMLFNPVGAGTAIDYQADIQFDGWKIKWEPVLRPLLVRLGRQAMAGLQKALSPFSGIPRIKPFDYLADKAVLPGMIGFSRIGYSLSRKWFQPNPADLTGKTIVLTGATSGIGRAAAFQLAGTRARLALISRNPRKGDSLKSQIMMRTGNHNIALYQADISRMADVKRVASEILRNESRIDVLINNAGALFTKRCETDEGFECTLATDLLGPFYLTRLLIPRLMESEGARIVNVSSGGMYTQKIDLEDIQNRKKPYNGAKAYARAKRGLVILTELWADRFKEKGLVVHAMHPGWVETKGVMESLPEFYKLTKPVLRSPDQGADTIVWLASSREAGMVTGKFWLDRRPHVTHIFPGTRETDHERDRLWQELNHLTGEQQLLGMR